MRKRNTAAVAVLSCAAWLAPTANGQDVDSRLERFRLFNACRPMRLLVERLRDDAAEIELTRSALQAAAESRLHEAGLATDSLAATPGGFLYINVNVVERAYNITVQYSKFLTDEFGSSGYATSWDSSATGTHGGDADYIMSNLSRHLDRFLAVYLRVNEPACGSAPR